MTDAAFIPQAASPTPPAEQLREAPASLLKEVETIPQATLFQTAKIVGESTVNDFVEASFAASCMGYYIASSVYRTSGHGLDRVLARFGRGPWHFLV